MKQFMKRFLLFVVALLFVATGIQAQKIDARLTNLLSDANGVSKTKSAVRGQQQEIDTAAVKQDINVSFNSVTAGSGHFVTVTDYPDPNVTKEMSRQTPAHILIIKYR